MANKFLQLDNGDKVRIKLVQEDDRITIKGEDESGEVWFLFGLKNDGTFCRHTGVAPFGFNLDYEGRITESPE